MKLTTKFSFAITSFILTVFTALHAGSVQAQGFGGPTVQVDPRALGFAIPSLGDILTFLIRFFFAIAGLAALLYLLLGAFGWITSGGSKEGVEKAREKIQAAVIGVVLIVIVLALIWTLEQVVFAGKICFGISCPLTLPTLIKPTNY